MGVILSYIAIQDGKVKRSSLEVLSRCRELAERDGHTLKAVVAEVEPGKYADEIAAYGAGEILAVAHAAFDKHRNEPLRAALAQVIEAEKPVLVAFASTEAVKDVLGALAVRTGAAAIPDVASFDLSGDGVEAWRPVMAAKVLANTTSNASTTLVSVRSGSYDAVSKPGPAQVTEVAFQFDAASVKAQLVEVKISGGGTVDLSEAPVVVAAGRGVKDDDGKAMIEKRAGLLGGAVGASRADTESGLFPATMQICQTGKVVSPQLYIAVGISGAIQHVAGMANSKVIVAVNKDADAPIFQVADYGIVGDLNKVVPAFIRKLETAG